MSFIPPIFTNFWWTHPNQSFNDLFNVRKYDSVRLSELWVTDSRCEFLILSCFYFQMSGMKILKHNEACLKELRNCILCIIREWSLFCSVRVYVSLYFLLFLLVKLLLIFLCFRFLCFCIFGFQFLVLLY